MATSTYKNYKKSKKKKYAKGGMVNRPPDVGHMYGSPGLVQQGNLGTARPQIDLERDAQSEDWPFRKHYQFYGSGRNRGQATPGYQEGGRVSRYYDERIKSGSESGGYAPMNIGPYGPEPPPHQMRRTPQGTQEMNMVPGIEPVSNPLWTPPGQPTYAEGGKVMQYYKGGGEVKSKVKKLKKGGKVKKAGSVGNVKKMIEFNRKLQNMDMSELRKLNSKMVKKNRYA